MNKILKPIIFLLLIGFSISAFTNEPVVHENEDPEQVQSSSHGEEDAHHGEEGFDPKSFIFHHIQDAYEWHIASWESNGKSHHVYIPLPVILYSKVTKDLHVFMSSKFHHPPEDFQFHVPHHGEFAGKIVEKNAGGEEVRPIDISITKNVSAAIFSIFLMLWIFLSMAKRYKVNPIRPPKGIGSAFEPIIIFVRDEIAKPSIGDHKYERFMPYLLTIFFFIWINNMLGLVPVPPGGANLTGNIAVTLTLALFTYIITTLSGNRNYWKHIFNTPGVPVWLKIPVPLMPAIEFLGTIIKPITLMIRLFANITAGHIIVLSLFAMLFIFGQMQQYVGYLSGVIVVPFTIFMTFLELLVALIQAYVFTMLSALYFGMATEEAHH